LREHVLLKLDVTIDAVSKGDVTLDQAYGAIAPPAQLVPDRWNLLLDMDPMMRSAIGSILDKSGDVFEDACGKDAMLCDLSALISDPGIITD